VRASRFALLALALAAGSSAAPVPSPRPSPPVPPGEYECTGDVMTLRPDGRFVLERCGRRYEGTYGSCHDGVRAVTREVYDDGHGKGYGYGEWVVTPEMRYDRAVGRWRWVGTYMDRRG
jgi:hypothetical protein